ncbi:unnamed protein product [Brassicogethes aeneus]|uniref:Uncharacterized protein n=1 Tax=Brassicogethes aeneus TaxID=1431903 RepID=A0A9P0FCG5_BRAAE|nr:unnamed protein product [Brassicogethes aeneus]
MHQDSDIFCLKETKAGENDGRGIFSINGSCSMRINRKPNAHHEDAFQYGSINMPNRVNPAEPVESENGVQERGVASEAVTEEYRSEEEVEPVEAREDDKAEFTDEMSKEVYDKFIEDMKQDLGEDVVESIRKKTVEESTGKKTPPQKTTGKKTSPKSKNKPVFKKVNKVEEPVSSSQIMRNPLTGAGMECDEHKNQRKNVKNTRSKDETGINRIETIKPAGMKKEKDKKAEEYASEEELELDEEDSIINKFIENIKKYLGDDVFEAIKRKTIEEVRGKKAPHPEAKSKKVLPKLKKQPEVKEANKVDEPVCASMILRNPLTGAGMECEKFKDQRKHIKSKFGSWIW